MRLVKICLSLLSVVMLMAAVTNERLHAEDGPKKIPKEILEKLKKEGVTIIEGGTSLDDGPDPYANAIPMRWRVYSSQENGVAFRFPYFYSTPDQYKPKIVRRHSWFMRSGDFKADIELKTAAVTAGKDLAAMAGALIGQKDMQFVSYDYYQAPDVRPFAHDKWAPLGVEAVMGSSDSHVALVLQYEGKINALVLTGAMDYKDNLGILETFEVLNRRKKDQKRKKGPLLTYRESLFLDKKVLDDKGRPQALSDAGPAAWDQTWELETAHYHLTCQVSPAKLYYYGLLCEALYREFYSLYEPDTVIPYKMEIHIFNTFNDFSSSAASIGTPVGFGTGGFFFPKLLCIFAYEKSTDVAPDFTPSKVIAHELSHQFLHLTCNGSRHVPTWINEGLAVYFETFLFKSGKYINRPPKSRISQLVAVYGQQKNVLWSMDNYVKHYGHIPGLNYAEVYAMTHFWIFGAGKQGKSRFVEYWKALKNGEDGTESFERIFLDDIIKAKGSRAAAIRAWEIELQKYVLGVLAKLN